MRTAHHPSPFNGLPPQPSQQASTPKRPQSPTLRPRTLALRSVIGLFLSLTLLFSCLGERTAGLENPPCVIDVEPASNDGTASIPLRPTFRVTFSKVMQPTTLNGEFIYLVQDQVDFQFLRDVESPPVTQSRIPRLVPLTVTHENIEEGGARRTIATITPLSPLRGDTLYDLVLTRGLRDELRLISAEDNRYTGSRPLNACADENGIWRGDVTLYRSGQSRVFSYKTEPAPPRSGRARVTEIKATSSIPNGAFVEIQNASENETLDICGFLLDDGTNSLREIVPARDRSCVAIPPKGFAVIVEPDYDLVSNPHNIPAAVAIYTTNGSTTTFVNGGLASGEVLYLYENPESILEQLSPRDITSGNWPSRKSLEKCEPDGPNNPDNWRVSTDPADATPGRKNSCTP